jgi:hypothetical protein
VPLGIRPRFGNLCRELPELGRTLHPRSPARAAPNICFCTSFSALVSLGDGMRSFSSTATDYLCITKPRNIIGGTKPAEATAAQQGMLEVRCINGLVFVGVPLIWVFQIIATNAGLVHFTGWSQFVTWPIAIIIGWIPLIGTATGTYGAVITWHWPWYGAVALFISPIILIMTLIGTAVVQSRM